MHKKILLQLIIAIFPMMADAQVRDYTFEINTKPFNVTGKTILALAVGGSIPAPTIEATEGNTLRVTFINKMDVESSIHWHGVLLPNDQDGVPYLTTQPIAAHTTFTYEFPVKHSGTYWYHSHTGLQEQRGVYGAIVFHPKDGELVAADQDKTVVFSDWTNTAPEQVLANLKKDGDYYALKKDSVQSWLGVLSNGWPAFKNRLNSSWTRMGAMDISDIGYDAFLANGKQESVIKAAAGEKVRLRLVNAAASSYFYVEYAGGAMTIVAADGIDVKPVKVKRLRMAIAETYDVIVDVPKDKSYELRNTSEDGTGYASTFIGNGEKQLAPLIVKPNPYIMDHHMHGGSHNASHNMQTTPDQTSHHQSAHQPHQHASHPAHQTSQHVIENMQDYSQLQALQDTTMDYDKPWRIVNLDLTGNMERYVWSFDNKVLSEADKIMIKKGENARFVLTNKTMMHHPIHLHGHFFRVINGQGDKSPLKHTVNVPPMDVVTIEFAATEEKDWFFHCHNLYHMAAGMARVVAYEGTPTADRSVLAKLWHDKAWFSKVDVGVYNNMTIGGVRFSTTRDAFELEYDYDYEKSYDVDLIYERSLSRFTSVYLGGSFEREDRDHQAENTAIAGIHYILPMLIASDLRVDSDGDLRLGFDSELQLTTRAKFLWDYNTDGEYRFGLNYDVTKSFAISSIYDSAQHFGIGFKLLL